MSNVRFAKKIIIVSFVVFFIVLSFLGFFVLKTFLEKIKNKSIKEFSSKTGLVISVDRVLYRFPLSVVLKKVQVSTENAEPLFSAPEVITSFDLKKIVIKKTAVSISYENLDKLKEKLNYINIRTDSIEKKLLIIFVDNTFVLKHKKFIISFDHISGSFIRDSSMLWKLNLTSKASIDLYYGRKVCFLFNSSAFSKKDGTWKTLNEINNLFVYDHKYESLKLETLASNNLFILSVDSEKKDINLKAVWSNSYFKNFSCDLFSFNPPFSKSYITGKIFWDSNLVTILQWKNNSFSGNFIITNNLLKGFSIKENKKEIVKLLPSSDSLSVISGNLNFNLWQSSNISAAIKIIQTPEKWSVYWSDIKNKVKTFIPAADLTFRYKKSKIFISSSLSFVDGMLDFRDFQRSFFVFRPSLIGFASEDSGDIRINYQNLVINNLKTSFFKIPEIIFNANYSISSNHLSMSVFQPSYKIKILTKTYFSNSKCQSHGTFYKDNYKEHFKISAFYRNNDIVINFLTPFTGIFRITFLPDEKFQIDFDTKSLKNKKTTWKSFGNISGLLSDINSWYGGMYVEIFNFKKDILTIPHLVLNATKKDSDITISTVMYDQKKEPFNANVKINLLPSFSLNVDAFDSIKAKVFVNKEENKKIFYFTLRDDIKRFNNFFTSDIGLNGNIYFVSEPQKKRQFFHFSASNISIKNISPFQIDIKALQYNNIFKFNEGFIMSSSKGKITLLNGQISVSNSKSLFSFVLRSSFGNSFNGFIDIIGENNDSQLKFKTVFREWQISGGRLPKVTQFVLLDKKDKYIKFIAPFDGINAETKFRNYFYVNGEYVFEGNRILSFLISVSPEKKFNLSFTNMELPLRLLPLIAVDVVNSAKGTLKGEIFASGSLENPVWNGRITTEDANIVFKDTLGSADVKKINLSGRFIDNSFFLDKSSLVISGANANIEGQAELDGWKVKDFNFLLTFKSNQYAYVKRFNDIQGYVTGKCLFTLSDGLFLIKGSLFLKKMEFIYPFPSASLKGSDYEKGVLLDLNLTAKEDVRYYQPLNNVNVEIKPGGSLRLSGLFKRRKSGEEIVKGKVESTKGQIVYLGTVFNLRSAVLEFSEQYGPSTPNLTLLADTRVSDDKGKEIIIYLEGNGLLDENYNIKIYSSPALTPKEIVKLLGYGKLYDTILLKNKDTEKTIDLTAPTESEINSLLVAGVFTFFQNASESVLVRPVERRLKRTFGLDRLEIRPVFDYDVLYKGFFYNPQNSSIFTPLSGLKSTKFLIGKYLSDYLLIEYMLSFEKENENSLKFKDEHQFRLEVNLKAVSFEWKYRPSFSFGGFYPAPATQELEIRWQSPF